MFRVQPVKRLPEHESGPRAWKEWVDADPWGLHDGIDPESVDTSVEPEPNRFVVDRLPAFLVLPVLCEDRRGKKSTKKHGMSAGRDLHHTVH